jgi:S1-C subfamily serine protease
MSHILKQILAVGLVIVYTASCGCATLFDVSSAGSFKKSPRSSFVKLVITTTEYISMGSGIIINHFNNTNTIVLTAGHVCHDNTLNIEVLDLDEKSYKSTGQVIASQDDLCLVIVEGLIDAPAIRVANTSPAIGDHSYNIAAPLGMHAPNMSLMFDGYFQGSVRIEEEKYLLDIYSIPGIGGSSGSPVFNTNWEIIGIVSRAIPKFPEFVFCVNQERVKAFYDYALSEQFAKDKLVAEASQKIRLLDFVNRLLQLTIPGKDPTSL